MKNIKLILPAMLLTIVGLIKPSFSQTDGTVVFSVLTVSNGATFSPRNVLAIWVKDNQGNFVISRKVMASERIQHLVKWVDNSSQNTVNAITGATLPNHIQHTVSWDCRDLSGNLVPDGIYEIWVEYTSRNSAFGGDPGPYMFVEFEKGTTTVSLTPPDEQYFVDISLEYTPMGVSAGNELPPSLNFNNFPMPFADKMNIELTLKDDAYINISAYDLNGHRVKEIVNSMLPKGPNSFSWDGKNYAGAGISQGIYFLRIIYEGKVYSRKIMKLK
ncbi:MAG: DUF2271 domain-containing protein [Methanococcaceae archaeon]